MSWLALKAFASKAWLWLKTYWYFPAIVLWSIIVYIFSRRNSDAIIETLNARKESYKKQIDTINSVHRDEIIKRERLIREYENTISALDEAYREKKEKLTELQKEKVKDVIIKSRKQPDEIIKRIEEEFGIKYVK